jgi:hypothetical protein
MKVISLLLAGMAPEVEDLVLIRTAVQAGWDLYKPLHLENAIQAADLEVDAFIIKAFVCSLNWSFNAYALMQPPTFVCCCCCCHVMHT